MSNECLVYLRQVLSVLWDQWTLEVQQLLADPEHQCVLPFQAYHAPPSLQHLQIVQHFPLK